MATLFVRLFFRRWALALWISFPPGLLADEPQDLTADTLSAGANLGLVVDLSGDTLIAGAPGDSVLGTYGTVYVFERADGLWSEGVRLVNSKPAFQGQFGRNVAIDGDVAIASDPAGQGAFVFERINGVWSESQILLPPEGIPTVTNVAVEGDKIVINAPRDNTLGVRAGAAFVFQRGATGWESAQRLLASDWMPFDSFGNGLAMRGDLIVVGSQAGHGAAYVFRLQDDEFIEDAKLVGSLGAPEESFGVLLDVDENAVAVGVDTFNACAARAYIFEHQAGAWIETARLLPGPELSCIAASVAISGSHLLVGDPAANKTHFFRRESGGWVDRDSLVARSSQPGDDAGIATRLFGKDAIVGSPRAGSGIVYAFLIDEIFADTFSAIEHSQATDYPY